MRNKINLERLKNFVELITDDYVDHSYDYWSGTIEGYKFRLFADPVEGNHWISLKTKDARGSKWPAFYHPNDLLDYIKILDRCKPIKVKHKI